MDIHSRTAGRGERHRSAAVDSQPSAQPNPAAATQAAQSSGVFRGRAAAGVAAAGQAINGFGIDGSGAHALRLRQRPPTMDQVVDRFIEREHGLMKALATRTPVVETYLQNLVADPQLGPVPSEDHYFLGRLDMGETVDRKDYLKEQDKGMQTRLMGGFNKLFKVEYQPIGFSWMVYARPHRF